MDEVFIQIRKLTAIKGSAAKITLDINRGSIVALTGLPGSGKTAFLSYLSTMSRPEDNGIIRIGGLDLYNEPDIRDIRRRMGAAFQRNEENFLFKSLGDDIRFINANLGKGTDKKELGHLLGRFGISWDIDRPYKELSNSQRVRSKLCLALLMDPEIIILDEAFEGYGSGREKVFRDLISEAKRKGLTLIFSSKVSQELEQADRVLTFEEGEVRSDQSSIIARHEELRGLRRVTEHMRLIDDDYMSGISNKRISISSYSYDPAATGHRDPGEKGVIHDISNEKIQDVLTSGRSTEEIPKSLLRRSVILRNAGYRFKDGNVISHINLAMLPGRLYVIEGEGGAGKTALLNMINGRIKLKRGRLKRIRGRIGYLPEEPGDMLYKKTVIKNVMEGPLALGLGEEDARKKAVKALRRCGIPDELHGRKICDLSSAEMRMTEIAMVIAARPRIWLLDEPMLYMDGEYERIISALISEHISDGGTVIVCTQNIA